MTDSTMPSDEDQAQEYVQQLRSAPVEQVVAEVLSGLLSAAQAKLGRRDARLLIDLSAGMHEHVRGYVPADLTRQLDQVLAQLRLAQVRAEGAVASQPQAEPNDLAETPAPPAGAAGGPAAPAAPAPSPPQPAPPQPSPVSRLWVPGRDL